MDLSKATASESGSDESEFAENYDEEEEDEENGNNSSENDSKMSSNFSIQNLAKPHVSEYVGTGSGLGQGSHDMREYVTNTMRELLSIYGLTSEVAESISRQLPIAAFSSGKFCFYIMSL